VTTAGEMVKGLLESSAASVVLDESRASTLTRAAEVVMFGTVQA